MIRFSECEQLVNNLLERFDIQSPPVDAYLLADKLGIQVIHDASHGRGRLIRIGGHPTIFVNPSDRPERVQWSLAHEIGEVLVAEADVFPEDRESTADLLASRILLPGKFFFAKYEEFEGDLYRLKTAFQTASCEAIAKRTLDLDQPACLSIYDQGKRTLRCSNRDDFVPQEISRIESELRRRIVQSGRPCTKRVGSLIVRGWPVDEPGWHREILRTSNDD